MLKQLFFCIAAILITFNTHADTETLQWYVDGNLYTTTTCESGGDVILPAAPTKTGYNFDGWIGYTQVEYLETGVIGPIIDTGYTPSYKTRIKTKFVLSDISNGKAFVFGEYPGGHTASTSYEFFVWGGGYNLVYSGMYYTGNARNDDVIELDWNKNVLNFSVNGVNNNHTYNQTNFTSLYTMPLFGLRSSATFPSAGSFVGKIYYFQIYDNDVLVHDFVPALDGNNTPCMYDKVTEQFFYNQGTGQFIAGPAVGE